MQLVNEKNSSKNNGGSGQQKQNEQDQKKSNDNQPQKKGDQKSDQGHKKDKKQASSDRKQERGQRIEEEKNNKIDEFSDNDFNNNRTEEDRYKPNDSGTGKKDSSNFVPSRDEQRLQNQYPLALIY